MTMHIGSIPFGTGGTAFWVRSASCGGFLQPFAVFGMASENCCIRNLPVIASTVQGRRANISG